MAHYESDPNAEITGQNVQAFIQNSQAEQFRPVLEKHGMAHIDPEQWYPLNSWLAVLSDLSEQPGYSASFVGIGLGISQTAVLPPDMDNMTFEQFLTLFPDIYQMQHRNGDVGYITVEMLSENHARVVSNTPFPIDLDYGAIYGFAKRFLPPGTNFVVEYVEDCELTDSYGTLDITWG